MVNITKYLHKQHVYGKTDCITLVQQVYLQEFNIHIKLPIYPNSKQWMLYYSPKWFDDEVQTITKKIPLTKAKNFDLLVFKQNDKLTHFGLYISSNKMLHIEEKSQSYVSLLDDYWLAQLHGVYRHNDLV